MILDKEFYLKTLCFLAHRFSAESIGSTGCKRIEKNEIYKKKTFIKIRIQNSPSRKKKHSDNSKTIE
jgi:hypothetical protein